MTEREALKLARQLLWRYRHETPMGDQPHMICQEVDEAFERIDEALAQQPEQEPVIDKSAAIRIATSLGWTQQRKPLTDEQIEKIADEYGAGGWICDFARAIEAAHGIKGEA